MCYNIVNNSQSEDLGGNHMKTRENEREKQECVVYDDISLETREYLKRIGFIVEKTSNDGWLIIWES